MKTFLSIIIIIVLEGCSSSGQPMNTNGPAQRTVQAVHLPWKEAGCTERQAAAHLLDRFAFGARPNEVDAVVAMGINRWFLRQLRSQEDDSLLEQKLSALNCLTMSNDEIAAAYPPPGQIYLLAVQEGAISNTEMNEKEGRVQYKDEIRAFAVRKGFHPFNELKRDLTGQKILRARYSRNQLQEVLTDFWFNHFNVSITDNQCRSFVLTYERDAIRPYVFSTFRKMLEASAKHPAMLTYLDNAQSSSEQGVPTTMSLAVDRYRNMGGIKGKVVRRKVDAAMKEREELMTETEKTIPEEFKRKKGINENYARELLELHTLGVDGGYSQNDVVNVARALTGWSVYPAGPFGAKARERLDKRMDKAKNAGFVREGNFFFRADIHDANEKTILGQSFPAGGGMEEGERVLDIVANHPSTANHIARKMAVRFVSDTPSDTLVQRLSTLFLNTNGDLTAMIVAIAESPEFWNEQSSRRAKIKSPFEYVISALRATDADLQQTNDITRWMERMGEPLFACQPPTGYSDKAEAWVNSGALLNRMNFGLNLAANGIKGVWVDLAQLNNNREPESSDAAMETYSSLLLPERNIAELKMMIDPLTRQTNVGEKLEEQQQMNDEMGMEDDASTEMEQSQTHVKGKKKGSSEPSPLAHVVGIILGSPEFQRR